MGRTLVWGACPSCCEGRGGRPERGVAFARLIFTVLAGVTLSLRASLPCSALPCDSVRQLSPKIFEDRQWKQGGGDMDWPRRWAREKRFFRCDDEDEDKVER